MVAYCVGIFYVHTTYVSVILRNVTVHKQTEYNRALRMHMQQPWQDILMFLVRDKECREREGE